LAARFFVFPRQMLGWKQGAISWTQTVLLGHATCVPSVGFGFLLFFFDTILPLGCGSCQLIHLPITSSVPNSLFFFFTFPFF
jgi:hypothetical protein